MTLDELRAQLDTGRICPAYLLAGSEPLLRDDALAAITAKVIPGAGADFDLDRLDGASTSAARLLDATRMLPVVAPRRLVVLREPEAIRGGGRELLRGIVEAVEELGPQEHVVLAVVASRADRRAAWVRAFADPAVLVDCNPPTRNRELTAFVRGEAKHQQLTLAPGVAELLVDRVGPHLLALRQELGKAALVAEDGRITVAQVTELAADLAEEPIWDLTDAIGEGRSADALEVLTKLLAAGSPPPLVLGALASHFRRLLQTRAGRPPSGPPFVRRKLEAQAKRYSLARTRGCLGAIHRADEALKGQGVLPPEMALEQLVLALVS